MTKYFFLAALAAFPYRLPAQALNVPWNGYAHDPQHTGTSATAAQPLISKHWQTSVDQNPPGGGSGPLFVHYGSPVITASNTILVPVTTAAGNYQLNAFAGSNGALLYTLASDYTVPANAGWVPPYGPALALGTRVYYPGAGGTVYYRDLPNSATGPNGQAGATGQIAFYGMSGANGYSANKSAFNTSIHISTPLTADRFGNIYFGFTVAASNPAGIVSGVARLTAAGTGSWVSAVSLTGDSAALQLAQNGAPALNNNQTVLYVATSNGQGFGTGYLASLNAATLAPISHVELDDPRGGKATVSADSTAAPLVGPDGDVYFGVLESPCCTSHRDRGWLLHFDAALAVRKIPGSFGWDDTPSIVPSSIVPSYAGTSSYLLLTKYNNYASTGGNGVNQIALIDPFAGQTDLYGTSVSVMKEVIAVNGITPDSSGPPAVREWCINAAAIDPFTKAAIVNSEDGVVYRWDFTTNTLSQHVTLTAGRGEAYTPTLIGPDGTVYAVNDSILFAVGELTGLRGFALILAGAALMWAEDPVAALASRIEQGRAHLDYAAPYGYLPALLDALHIPVESQISVFSKTSIQAMRIEPANPRVIYFNDAVSVGWVRNGFLELAAQDAGGAIHYYVLQQRPGERLTPRQDCVRCHQSGALQLRTAVTGPDGIATSEADMLPATPYSHLFGGWYVTGKQVPPGHSGNTVFENGSSHVIAPALGRDVALRPSSDIVALLVFRHQVRVMNLLAARPVNVDELASALTFADEAPLPGPIRGDSGFAEVFSAGRMRNLDLERTLMRYPSSYMVESDAFQALPQTVKTAVYRRMEEMLRKGDSGPFPKSARNTAREMIREIAARN